MLSGLIKWVTFQGKVMDEFLVSLAKFPPHISILILILAIILTVMSQWKSIVSIFKVLTKQRGKRSCGDCILYISGMKTKCLLKMEAIDKNVLKAQMNYVEIQLHDAVFYLTGTFKKDIDRLGVNISGGEKAREIGYYHEALLNAFEAVKDEFRRSFKENGFHEMSEIEFSTYVRMKYANLLTIAREYLSHRYIETSETIVKLSDRFAEFDEQRFEESTFLCYRNAKQVVVDAKRKKELLEEKFNEEIDSFLRGAMDKPVQPGK
jgi:hypothetical protein